MSKKEKISINDITFLLMLSAYENSSLDEVPWIYRQWECNPEDVLGVLKHLIEKGDVRVFERLDFVSQEIKDYDVNKSLKMISSLDKFNTHKCCLFLTKEGEKRYDEDDFDISDARVNYLMFSK